MVSDYQLISCDCFFSIHLSTGLTCFTGHDLNDLQTLLQTLLGSVKS